MDQSLMTLITTAMVYDEIQEMKKMVRDLIEKQTMDSVKVISTLQACRLLKIGQKKLIHLVNTGQIKAVTYRDNKKRIRYRFRIPDIYEFQKSHEHKSFQLNKNIQDGRETAEDIAKRIFKRR
ncbi:MAG: hypothetical protein WC099_03705 [Candidatus Paceibacterota bacterium]